MTKVVFTPLAKDDLTEIGDYIAFQLQNKTAARNVVAQIRHAVERLRMFPECGTMLPYGVTPYRYLISGSYMIFYHLMEDNCACIDRILYGRSDYLAVLFDDK